MHLLQRSRAAREPSSRAIQSMYLLPLRPGKARLVARVTAGWQGCFLSSSYRVKYIHRAFLPSPQGAVESTSLCGGLRLPMASPFPGALSSSNSGDSTWAEKCRGTKTVIRTCQSLGRLLFQPSQSALVLPLIRARCFLRQHPLPDGARIQKRHRAFACPRWGSDSPFFLIRAQTNCSCK